MPGMEDTILNVGLNDETTEGLARITGDALFAYECYYRLIMKYSASVFGLSIADEEYPTCSSADEMRQRAENLLEKVATATGNTFPQDPMEQLMGALKAISYHGRARAPSHTGRSSMSSSVWHCGDHPTDGFLETLTEIMFRGCFFPQSSHRRTVSVWRIPAGFKVKSSQVGKGSPFFKSRRKGPLRPAFASNPGFRTILAA